MRRSLLLQEERKNLIKRRKENNSTTFIYQFEEAMFIFSRLLTSVVAQNKVNVGLRNPDATIYIQLDSYEPEKVVSTIYSLKKGALGVAVKLKIIQQL